MNWWKALFLADLGSSLTSHVITDTTRVKQFLDSWKHNKYACHNRKYKMVNSMCGRSSNFNYNDMMVCSGSEPTNEESPKIFSPNLDAEVYERSRSPKAYKIGTRRNLALPDIIINTIRISESAGPSEKFDFSKPYIGIIIWAHKQNGRWYVG